MEISSIHWNQSCPDGSKKDVKYSHVFHSSQQPTEPQQIALTINPTERQVQFLDEPLVEQFAVDAVANVETSSSSQPVTDEESQAIEQLSPEQRRALRNEVAKAHRGMGHPNQGSCVS